MNEKPIKIEPIALELIFKVIENRGYQRDPKVESMNTILADKLKRFYEPSRKR